jgi:hypothetical protein
MREFVPRLIGIVHNKWIKRSAIIATGASAGFAYYYFVGCHGGVCPISGNPYISTAYGAVIGILIFTARNKPDR